MAWNTFSRHIVPASPKLDVTPATRSTIYDHPNRPQTAERPNYDYRIRLPPSKQARRVSTTSQAAQQRARPVRLWKWITAKLPWEHRRRSRGKDPEFVLIQG